MRGKHGRFSKGEFREVEENQNKRPVTIAHRKQPESKSRKIREKTCIKTSNTGR